MIPRLLPRSQTLPEQSGFFKRLVEAGFRGDIEIDAASQTVFATDNSIYEVRPNGVLFPLDIEDLKTIACVLGVPECSEVSIAPRGGGTSTNGQSLTNGVVVDCSRYMNRIVEIDAVRRVARVQAGVVKDQLNRMLKPYGLFFAPELSTSNRATIGGMVATDASGQGSCLYGKTSNHVLGLHVVLTDGTSWWSRPLDAEALADMKSRQDRIGEIYRTVERIAYEKRDQIAEIFPKLNRYMTGYDLAHIFTKQRHFNLNSVLCGSEGTLGIIAEAELNLLPIPKHAALVVIRYSDFNAALEDARMLAALNVASVETVDDTVLDLARGDNGWSDIARFFPNDVRDEGKGANIVEVLADEAGELAVKLAQVTSALDAGESPGHQGYVTTSDKNDIAAIWTMRKRAVGLLGNVEGSARPVPFVEDTAVPPENLATYIREFRALLDGAGLSYGMFGHVDSGVLHVRPALDLTRDEHLSLVRDISDSVVALTRKYGGVLWGEHGKGVRSEYVPEYFGLLYPSLQEIKRVFDPHNQLNPGKIATPDGQPLLKIDGVPLRGNTDRDIGNDIRRAFNNSTYCNGNGACFDFDETSPMCPSYKATRDRRYSPKGRAALMREWLFLLTHKGIDPRKEAKKMRMRSAPSSLVVRTWNTLNPKNRDDFSHEVRAAMDTCLACKACAGQCPVKVSVPTFRAQFLELYYGRYLRSLKDPIVASIEFLLPLMARVAPVYNLAINSWVGKISMRAVGLTALPSLPKQSLMHEVRRLGVETASVEHLRQLSPTQRSQVVIFVVDVFTAHFDPAVIASAFELARRLGFAPYLFASTANGKALHVHGYLGRFERTAAKVSQRLEEFAQMGIPLVGIDPSMTMTYRSEYPTFADRKPKAHVLLPQEWLSEHLDRFLPAASKDSGRTVRLMLHCTERSNIPAAGGQWAEIFTTLGVMFEIVDVGCCGMAGTFGHEVGNRNVSEKLYGMSWAAPIAHAASSGDTVAATGYSCRSQIKQIDGKRVEHPLQILNRLQA